MILYEALFVEKIVIINGKWGSLWSPYHSLLCWGLLSTAVAEWWKSCQECVFTCVRMCQRKEWRLKWTETSIYHCDGGCYGFMWCVWEYIIFVLPSFCVFCLLCSRSLRDPVCAFVFGACTHMHLFVLGFFSLYRGASAISSAWTVDPHSPVLVPFYSGWVGVRRHTIYNFYNCYQFDCCHRVW